MDPTQDKFCQFLTATLETLSLFLEVIAFADIGKVWFELNSSTFFHSPSGRSGSVVGASVLGPKGREFERWPVHPRCVLKQNT